MLSRVVAQSLKPVKRLAQCWELLRPFARSFTDHRNDVKMLKPLAAFTLVLDIKPRANGHNTVGQKLPILSDVTRSVRLHTLLRVVGSCCAKFETGQTFSAMLGVTASVCT